MTSRHSEHVKAVPLHSMNAYKESGGMSPLILNLGRSIPGKVSRNQLNMTLLGSRAQKCEEIISIVSKISGQIIILATRSRPKCEVEAIAPDTTANLMLCAVWQGDGDRMIN
jgi:hypothetical protein